MPGVDGGLELSRRAHAARPGLPIILLTGHDFTAPALERGRAANACFRKPFDGQALLAAVSKAVKPSGE